jgi:hypothetical protein
MKILFMREVNFLISIHLYGCAALILKEYGYSVEEAYEHIFKRKCPYV